MNSMIANNSLKLPIGTKFSIKQNGLVNKQINIINGSKQNEFFAFFKENDVDFEICCDNRECDRGIKLDLIINEKKTCLYFEPKKIFTVKALETNGRKLHFISQNSDDGRVMVTQTAKKYGISYQLASINCSRIKFCIEVEECKIKRVDVPLTPTDITLIGKHIQLFIKTLTGKTISINIGLNNTIRDIKLIIANKERILPDKQLLIVAGKLLEDERKISDYSVISNDSTLQLTIRLRGGYQFFRQTLTAKTKETLNSANDSHANSACDRNTKASTKLFSGERGVVCFGERSDEKIWEYDGFKRDSAIKMNPFVIEMRMESRY